MNEECAEYESPRVAGRIDELEAEVKSLRRQLNSVAVELELALERIEALEIAS